MRRYNSRHSFFSEKVCSPPRENSSQTISENIEKEKKMDLSIQAKGNKFKSEKKLGRE